MHPGTYMHVQEAEIRESENLKSTKTNCFWKSLHQLLRSPGQGRLRSVQRATGLKQVVLLMVRMCGDGGAGVIRDDDDGGDDMAMFAELTDGCDGLEHVSVRKP